MPEFLDMTTKAEGSPRIADGGGHVGSGRPGWSGRDWRMPVWLWVGLAAMFVSVLHIVLDFGASAGILGAVWAALTNGFPIVYCPPSCPEARPLTDVGHVGSIAFGILLALAAIWSLWRARARPGWFMPAVAAVLGVGTVVSLANTPIT